jgi:hypothetical protein
MGNNNICLSNYYSLCKLCQFQRDKICIKLEDLNIYFQRFTVFTVTVSTIHAVKLRLSNVFLYVLMICDEVLAVFVNDIVIVEC